MEITTCISCNYSSICTVRFHPAICVCPGLVFLDCMAKVQRERAQVLVIATAQSKQQLLKDVVVSRGQHVFEKILEISPPTLVSLSLEAFLSAAWYLITIALLYCL